MFGNRAMYADGWKAVVLHRPITWDFFKSWKFEDDVWELYHVDADPNELHDLAKQQPAKLAELQQLFDDAAKRDHVYPLGPNFLKYKLEQIGRQLGTRKGVFAYSGIVRGISMEAAPPTLRLPFVMRATFDANGRDSRVLVAHGGSMGGYSVYLKDGIPVYCYNLFGSELTYVRGPAALPAGKHELIVTFRPDPQGAATVALAVDGTDVADGTIPKLAPFTYEASDGFSVGVDQGSSVSPATVDARAAAVEWVRFEFQPPPSVQ
jgi:arylsulfatase